MVIDTSILLRTLQPAHPQRETARAAIKTPITRGREIHIVPQTLVELQVVATRPIAQNALGLSTTEAAAELVCLRSMFPLLPDPPAIYTVQESLVDQYRVAGKPAHDARLVAAMRMHGLTSILTFDRTVVFALRRNWVLPPADAASWGDRLDPPECVPLRASFASGWTA